jgi:Tol biopolymer transport system component
MTRVWRLLCLVAVAASVASAQGERPRLAWIEPGAPAEYAYYRVQPGGGIAQVGAAFTCDWIAPSPSGRYTAYWRTGEAALHMLDLSIGTDRLVPDLSLTDPSKTRAAQWCADTLWLHIDAGPDRPAPLVAIAAAVPASVVASGTYNVDRFYPTDDGAAAYIVARVGGQQSTERAVCLCRAAGGAAKELAQGQHVVRWALSESDARVALLASRTDRAGYVMIVCDRDSGQEVILNPEAGAFQSTYSRAFAKIAYTTGKGIVVQELGGDPVLVQKHLPDRRFALGYSLTPSGNALLVETPGDKARTNRVFTRYALDGSAAATEIARLPIAAGGAGSTMTWSDDGASLLLSTPLPGESGEVSLQAGPSTGPLKALCAGRVLSTRFSASGKSLAVVSLDPDGAAAGVRLFDVGAPSDAAPLCLATGRDERGRLIVPGLSLAFAPGGERLLVTGTEAGASRPGVFVLGAPGASSARVSADYIVRSARWSTAGERVLVEALCGRTGNGIPLASILAADPAGTTEPAVASGNLQLVSSTIAADGAIVGQALTRPSTRKLVISRVAREALPLSAEIDADDPVWSPDGTVVAFRSPVGLGAYTSVYVGRPQTQPVLVSGELLVDNRPLWLPDGGRLFFTAVRAGDKKIGRIGYLANVDGTAPRELGPMDRIEMLPDQSGILFRAEKPEPGVYRLAFDAPDKRVLVAAGGEGAMVAPDGKRALVVRDGKDGLSADVVTLDGGARVPLPSAYYTALLWSPDSTRIAAVTSEGPSALVIVGLDGKQTPPLVTRTEEFAWSRTGGDLAAIATSEEGTTAISCWSADGQSTRRSAWPPTLRPLSAAPYALTMLLDVPSTQLEWSPDGRAVLGVGYSAGDGSVYGRVFLPATEESYPLDSRGSLARFAWSPDGKTLAALSYADPARTEGSARPLVIGDVVDGRFHTISGDAAVEGFAWLPDGRIAYWVVDGKPEQLGTFVTGTDGAGAFQLGPGAASSPNGALWPLAPEPVRREIRWRTPPPASADSGRG